MKNLNVNPGACGILGILSLDGNQYQGEKVLNSISCINYRGSDLGAGFAYFDNSPDLIMEGFSTNPNLIGEVNQTFSQDLALSDSRTMKFSDRFGEKMLWMSKIVSELPPLVVERIIDRVNSLYSLDENNAFRVVSAGNGLHIRKGVGFPSDIYEHYPDISQARSHLWLAHTRQPTNSPGRLPVFSHPFGSYNIAVVHNGDVSSFGANVQALINQGMSSFVGTDSEMIAKILSVLLHGFNLTIDEAASVLCGGELSRDEEFGGFALDGPFSIAASIRHNNKDYLLAMADRSKLRPALVGISDSTVIVASERNQIKAFGDGFRIQYLKGGQYMIASSDGDVYFG